MPRITLPDGSERNYDGSTTPARIAADIGPGLAKSALGAVIDGTLTDLDTSIDADCELALVTPKTRDGEIDEQGLFLLRHSAAHVMAEAITNLFPGVQLVYGPPVEQGFYYDMAFPDGSSVSSEDFERIEAEMKRIVKEDRPFTRYEMPLAEGMKKLQAEGSKYKIDNAERAAEAGSDALSWYATGEPGTNWEDLCRGPHVPSTGRIGAFKVMNLASSYWHGDEKSDRLTRVYGIAFADKKQLKKHLQLLEEAKKRDHRVLGTKQELFFFDELSPGSCFFLPHGAHIYNKLVDFIKEEYRKRGYTEVVTPNVFHTSAYCAVLRLRAGV